ncbi:MAG: hypothetical protein OEU26_05355 [Candidatus Tectomicrobia bacterium]|nr:hypothetical protein [Candidatus Tectomicrobia bacterium]
MPIDVDGVPWRDLAECDETCPQRGLEVEAVLHRDVLEETVLGRRRRKKGEASKEAKVRTADRINRTDAGGVTEDRLEDEAEGETLLPKAFGLGRSQNGGEVVGAQLQEIGEEEEAPSTGRG